MYKIVKSLISNSLFQVLVLVILSFLLYDSISEWSVRFFLTVSVFLREILLFILPFLIFSFVSVALSGIKGTASVFLILFLVCLSSFFHTFLAGVLGYSLFSDSIGTSKASLEINEILPLIDFNFIKVTDNVTSLIGGVFVGILNSHLHNRYISRFINGIHNLVMDFMNKLFVKLLPLFIYGFLLKLLKEEQLNNIVCVDTSVFWKLAVFLIVYFFGWLFVAARFNWRTLISILKNITPALLVAFSTVSSAAAFPLSLKAATANTKDKRLADTVMPLTLSFHLAGDAVLVMLMCMMVSVGFNHTLPDLYNFVYLAIFFVFNQFAGAGVPNATIMVLIPVLRLCWNFDDSMCAFTIAFYSVVEPISTVGNVAANNIFVVLFKNVFGRFWDKNNQEATLASFQSVDRTNVA